MKKRVAEEIMALMDEKEGERLKKHPKFMKAEIEVEKPDAETSEGLDMEEKPMVEGEEELSPDMIKKLLEMMSGE